MRAEFLDEGNWVLPLVRRRRESCKL